MQSFNWVDIDGIRYSWNGQDNIVCTGRFGYQATMTGDTLNGLELESEDGEVAGLLNVDFAASRISFTPAEDAPLPHMMVRVLLAEQLYRAWSINANHPYHRE